MQQQELSAYQTSGCKRLYRCDECKAIIEDYPSQRTGDTIFCDRSCHNSYQSDPEPPKPYGCPHEACDKAFQTKNGLKTHYGYKHEGTIGGVELTCRLCKETFRRPPSQSHLMFCSRRCFYDFGKGGNGIDRVRRILGDRCWDAISEEVREEADDTCEMCGKDVSDDYRSPQVHHLLPLRAGGTHAEWNLIALCAQCHGKAEAFAHEHFEYSVLPAPGAFGNFHHL